jgi:DNA-binding NarL/FixJ family response regulator
VLTNALRHAPGARVSVSVRYGRDLVLEVLDDARRATPDVVLKDIRMPALDGLEASRRLLAGAEPPKVLVLTTFDEQEDLYETLRAGTSGFRLKVSPPEQLIGASMPGDDA